MKNIMKRITAAIIAAAAIAGGSAFASASELSDWAVDEFEKASEAGLLSYSVVANNMSTGITREQFCSLSVNLLYSLTGVEPVAGDVSFFSDTDSRVVSQAYLAGIVAGAEDGKFNPSNLITRQEMAKMLESTLTAAGVPYSVGTEESQSAIDRFVDSGDVSDWARSAMGAMLSYSFITGVSDTELKPQDNATKEQAIASVNRAYNAFSGQIALDIPVIDYPESDAIIEKGDLDVQWSGVSDAVEYTLIMKNADGGFLRSQTTTETHSVIPANALASGRGYIVLVGAKLSNGVEVYGVPVDFTVAEKTPEQTVTDTRSRAADVDNEKAKAVIATGEKYLGLPYKYGGTSPSTGFDCSGFMQYITAQNGISLHRTSREQYAYDGVAISKSELQPGDLVFFGSGGIVSHVGMYVGNGEMIHSPHTGASICFTSIESSYYVSRYIGAKRIM